jgi:hypothetical protein
MVERRAFVRCATALEASCQPVTNRKDVGWPGRVVDVSAGGVGILMRHCFRPGTSLDVELKTAAGEFLGVVRVRVAHATAVREASGSGWLIGCAFASPLSEAELSALLGSDARVPSTES